MRKSVLSLVFASAALFAFAGGALAQGPPPPPPGPNAEAPPPPGFGPAQANHESTAVSGVVAQYLLTPVGDVEGLALKNGTDVRFAPPMGAALAAAVKPGDHVSVTGFTAPQTTYGQAIKALSVTNTQTNKTVVVSKRPSMQPPPPPAPNNLQQMTVKGTLAHYILNDKGDIDGVILNNGYEVKFPPSAGSAIASASKQQPEAKIKASGNGTANAFGTVVDAHSGSLSIGGQSITMSGPPPPPPNA